MTKQYLPVTAASGCSPIFVLCVDQLPVKGENMTAYLAAMKSGKIGVEESREVIHKIRITLSFKNVKNLEEACADLVCGEKDKNPKVKCPVRIPTKILHITIQKSFYGGGTNIWDRFEPRIHKRVMDLFSSPEVIKQITSITVESDVQVEVTFVDS